MANDKPERQKVEEILIDMDHRSETSTSQKFIVDSPSASRSRRCEDSIAQVVKCSQPAAWHAGSQTGITPLGTLRYSDGRAGAVASRGVIATYYGHW